MGLKPGDITWRLGPSARQANDRNREDLGAEAFAQDVSDLRQLLCDYFNFSANCSTPLSSVIHPLGGGPGDWKRFKVRWRSPGVGKSGGLRLAVTADCKTRTVIIAGIWARKDDPTDAEFDDAFKKSGT